jgi:hypothetical protein
MSQDQSPSTINTPDWGPHLVIVFTVLIGVSLAQAFTVLGETNLETSQLLLIATVFYVVFDCWYGLNLNIKYIRATGGFDITLSLLTLVLYSCLPFLYLSHTASTPSFESPEILAVNLAAICIFDAIQRTRVFRRNGDHAPPEELQWHKRNSYLVVTGYAYAIILALGTIALTNWHASVTLRAGIILATWVVLRGIDYTVIDKIQGKADSAGQSPRE